MSIRLFTRSLRGILAALVLAFSLLLIVSHSLTAVHAAGRQITAGSTFVVNSIIDEPDADPSNGLCFSTPSGKCTLRAAIMEANFTTTPDTITIPSGVYLLTRPGYDDTALVGDLDITQWLTIQGAGAGTTIIDGNGVVTGDRVFHVLQSAVSVTLQGLTIRHGSVPISGVGGPSWGGGILINNAGVFPPSLHLKDVILEDNAALTGGGLYASTSEVDLQNTIVRTNTAVSGGAGGGIYAAFGGTLTMHDSKVYSNSAGNGGGAALEGMLNTRIERTEFYSNTAAGTGGGINNSTTFDFPITPLTLIDSNLHDNFSSFSGGGISTFSTLVLSRTVLNANHATDKGGGFYAASGNAVLSLQESTLSRNTAQFGGAIEYESSPGAPGALTLSNSTLSGNSVSHDGAGIYAIDGAKILLFNATIASNVLSLLHGQNNPLRGGGVFITDTAIITAHNTLIADNYYTNNLTQSAPDDCFTPPTTSLHSLGYNLIETTGNCQISGITLGNVTGQDPKLGPPQNNGGSTETRALLSNSPAIDAGDTNGCTNGQNQPLTTDQRRFRRPIGPRCDIGAVEYSPYSIDLPLIQR